VDPDSFSGNRLWDDGHAEINWTLNRPGDEKYLRREPAQQP
jgi:hypothetical protein